MVYIHVLDLPVLLIDGQWNQCWEVCFWWGRNQRGFFVELLSVLSHKLCSLKIYQDKAQYAIYFFRDQNMWLLGLFVVEI